jgi:hypothetical protein
MAHKILIAASLLTLLFVPAVPAWANQQRVARLAEEHGWLSNYRQAVAAARHTGKPLLVVFRCQP